MGDGLVRDPGLAAVAAIGYAIRRSPRPVAGGRRPVRLQVGAVVRGPLGRVLLGIGAFECGNCAATLLILRATELLDVPGGSGGATAALWLYAAYNAAAALTSVPAGRLVDRTTAVRVLTLGVVAFGVAYTGFGIGPRTVLGLVPWFVLAGFGIGFVETAEHATVASRATASVRGSAFGVLAGIQSAGNVAASTVAGVLWTVFSAGWAFDYLAACMLVSGVLLVVAAAAPPGVASPASGGTR